MVPMNIGQWKGIAILDTGSSYPLVNETMWAGVTGQGDILNPWLRGLLYLADGEGRQRLGWVDVKLIIQSQPVTLPCVILSMQMLLFPEVV